MFDVANVRLGFATNSSSSHSVLLREGPRVESPAYDYVGEEFGWDNFVLDSSTKRVSYLIAAVGVSLRRANLLEWQVAACLKELFPGFDGPRGYIDHQSGFTLPFAGADAFPALVKETLEFFCDERVVIFGGNDNCDDAQRGDFAIGDEYASIRIRRDGDNYVLFQPQTGAKVRIAPRGGTFTKASRPELVDLKITDYCPFGCSFCYQNSGHEGVEGDFYGRVLPIIEALGVKGLGVFEVALGGGEPTAYEHFAETVSACFDNGIVPNFTTYAVDWLLDAHRLNAARKCGGIGVSVHGKRDIEKAQEIADALPGVRVVAQHVFGSLPAKATSDLLYALHSKRLSVLLLGYKHVGRGGGATKHDMSAITGDRWALEMLKRTRLSVDTAMIANEPEFVAALGANEVSYTAQEGAFSMYVDAVTGTYGPSSYCDKAEMQALTSSRAGEIELALSEGFKTY